MMCRHDHALTMKQTCKDELNTACAQEVSDSGTISAAAGITAAGGLLTTLTGGCHLLWSGVCGSSAKSA
jgi:tRNA A37 threonylcarbamoyladenosine dehydratase